MNLLSFALLLTCTPIALIDFALPAWKAEPTMRIEDAYKWTYQATRGGEHAVPDKDSAQRWLDGEWKSLGAPLERERLWEPLCPDGEIGRLNLRPFRFRGGKADDLLDAFLASSRDHTRDESAFAAAWNELGRQLRKKSSGSLNRKAWIRLDAEMRAKGYPAIHHSKSYADAKNPAYRILTSLEMKKLLAKLK